MSTFSWTEPAELAAQLVAEDDLTNQEIADRIGITPRTLTTWKNHPEFAARVRQTLDAYRTRILAHGVADRVKRVRALNTRWQKLHRVIEERSADPEMQSVPGGATGLMVRQIKGVGQGRDFQMVETFEVDTGLLNELRQVEKQAAQEVGQWLDRIDHTTAGQALSIRYVNDWRGLPGSDDPPALPPPGAADGADGGA